LRFHIILVRAGLSVKQRLLVMNGQRLLQSEKEGQWQTVHVDKAMGIKPGIYDLHLARVADKSAAYDGVVLFADKEHVFQSTGKSIVRHDRNRFTLAPDTGIEVRITYGNDLALVAAMSIRSGRGRSR
jgi:hypothetical protein